MTRCKQACGLTSNDPKHEGWIWSAYGWVCGDCANEHGVRPSKAPEEFDGKMFAKADDKEGDE